MAAFKPFQFAAFGLLDTLRLEPLSTLGTLKPLLAFYTVGAFGALGPWSLDALRTHRTLKALPFDALRTFNTFHALAIHTLRTFRPLKILAVDALRTLCSLHALPLRTLRTFRTLKALPFRPLRTFHALGALALGALRTLRTLRLSLIAALAGLCGRFTVMASSFGTCRAGQRRGGDTSNQEKLASHYNLLAQSKLMNINRLL